MQKKGESGASFVRLPVYSPLSDIDPREKRGRSDGAYARQTSKGAFHGIDTMF